MRAPTLPPTHARRASLVLAALLLACDPNASGPDAPDQPDPPGSSELEQLSPTAHLVRTSLVLRGLLPSPDDLRAVRDDPAAIEGLVDTYLESPEFLEVIKDLHAELLQVRADVQEPLPAKGPLTGRKLGELYNAHSEEPLELVRHIVANDRPYTEVVTADYMLTNEPLSVMYGLAYDPSGPDWQVSHWSDDRPHAGLLSSSELWRRHESAGSNFHRLRANFIADTFLCADFANRDISVGGEVTISDEFEVAAVTRTDPGCVACHQALDPLAAFFWGFHRRFKGNFTARAYEAGCDTRWEYEPPTEYPPEVYCYPIQGWIPAEQQDWETWHLRAPAFYGTRGQDLRDLGQLIAADPRFSQCVARQFYGWFTQRDKEQVPLALAVDLQQRFEQSGFNTKALARAIVLSEPFRSHRALQPEPAEPYVGLQTIRPEQYARALHDLTGFAWRITADLPGCDDHTDAYGSRCWGEVDLMRSDLFGYRAMFGGITGYFVTRPTHTSTPTKELAGQAFAFEAAGYVVDRDLAEPDPSRRKLLHLVSPTTTDEPTVRAQLEALHLRMHGTFVDPAGPEVDASYGLFAAALDRGEPVHAAWKLTLSALLLDPALFFY